MDQSQVRSSLVA